MTRISPSARFAAIAVGVLALAASSCGTGYLDEIVIENAEVNLRGRNIRSGNASVSLRPGEGARVVGAEVEGPPIADAFFSDAPAITKSSTGYSVRVNDRLAYDVLLFTDSGDPTSRLALADVHVQRRAGGDGADSIQSEFGFAAERLGVVTARTVVRINGTIERTGPEYYFNIVAQLPE